MALPKFGTSGRPVFASSGRPAFSCATAPPPGRCCSRVASDGTVLIPTQMFLRWSGLRNCGCQKTAFGPGSFSVEFDGNQFANGTMLLTDFSMSLGSCRWYGTFPRGYQNFPTRFRYTFWDNDDCSGGGTAQDWVDFPEESAYDGNVTAWSSPIFPPPYDGTAQILIGAAGFGFQEIFRNHTDDLDCLQQQHANNQICEIPDPQPPGPQFIGVHRDGFATYEPGEYVPEADLLARPENRGFGPEDFA